MRKKVYLCNEPIEHDCPTCGGPMEEKECGLPAVVAVFMGLSDDPPELFCENHLSQIGAGWIGAEIPISEVREYRGKWQVQRRGLWFDHLDAHMMRTDPEFERLWFEEGEQAAIEYELRQPAG